MPTIPRRHLTCLSVARRLAFAAAVLFASILNERHAIADDGCDFEYHAGQTGYYTNCFSDYHRQVFYQEQLAAVTIKRTPARADVNMPAVCLYRIPCDWVNAFHQASITHSDEWTLSVSGSISGEAKISLGEALLRLLGLEISLTVTLGGEVEYTSTTTWGDMLQIEQQDCYDQTWKFWKTTSRVTGTVTEIEEYTWFPRDMGLDPDPNCPTEPVVTRCEGGATASGTAVHLTQIELEQILQPCCPTLQPPDPCCDRPCPR